MPGTFVGSIELTDVGEIKISGANVQEVFVGAIKVFPTASGPLPTSFEWKPEAAETPPVSTVITRASIAQLLTTTVSPTFWFQEAADDETHFHKLRRVQNLMAGVDYGDLNGWEITTPGAGIDPVISASVESPPPGKSSSVQQVVFEAGGVLAVDASTLFLTIGGVATEQKMFSLWIRTLAGTEDLFIGAATGVTNDIAVSVTTTWQRFVISTNQNAATFFPEVGARGDISGASAITVLIAVGGDAGPMAEVAQIGVTIPSEPIDPAVIGNSNIAGVINFATANGNSEVGGVVTEGAGVALVGGGILPEPLATNILLDSTNFDAGSWGNFGILTRTSNGINDLGLLQHTFDAEAGAGTHSIFASLTSVDDHTFYVLAKDDTGQYMNLGAGNSGDAFVTFDLTNGNVTETGTGLSISGRIDLISDGWYANETTLDIQPSGDDFPSIAASNTATPGALYPSFTGSNETFLACHSQHEKSLFPTSPIITGGLAASRQADVFDTGDTIAAEFGALLELTLPNVIGAGNTISLLGASASAVDVLRVDDAGNFIMDDGGTPVTVGTASLGSRVKISYGRDATGRSASLSGATAVNGGAPGSAHEGNTFQLGSTNSVNQSRCIHHNYVRYTVRPSDSELETLSA